MTAKLQMPISVGVKPVIAEPSEQKKYRKITPDRILNGRLSVSQPADGYRFSIDSIILAGLSNPQAEDRVLDIGTGCGIIPLILAHRSPALKIIGVELQACLSTIAAENIERNQMADRILILCQDMRQLSVNDLGGSVDYVISNPPYRPAQSGRINPNPQKALARHELAMTLSQLLATVRKVLRIGGRFILIYPSERLADLICQMRQHAIEPKGLHIIYSKCNEPAKLVVLEGVRGGRPGIQNVSSFVIYHPDGQYTAEMAKMFTE